MDFVGERDREGLARLGPDNHVLVAEADGRVVGFARMDSPHKKRGDRPWRPVLSVGRC
ncbi:MAG: hypothetical protein ACM3ZA_14960 [Bacillota bacterium]